MKFNGDFSCELIGLIVLMALSAASHFWYVMIGMAMVGGLILLGIGLLAVFVRAKREILARFLSPAHLEHAQIAEVSASTRIS
jgi:hypothetical protein